MSDREIREANVSGTKYRLRGTCFVQQMPDGAWRPSGDSVDKVEALARLMGWTPPALVAPTAAAPAVPWHQRLLRTVGGSG